MRNETPKAAKVEYETILDLGGKLTAAIRSSYSQGRQIIQNEIDAELASIKSGLRQAYEEIARRGYGRVVFADELDEDGNKIASTHYRLSQANAGFPDRPVRLVARNTPVGSKIASCAVGEELSLRLPRGEITLLVTGIIDISEMTGLLDGTPDAKRLAFRYTGDVEDQIIALRSFVESFSEPKQLAHLPLAQDAAPSLLETTPAQPEIRSDLSATDKAAEDSNDPFWDLQEGRTLFAEDAEASLGTQFFTQTTAGQEYGIQNVRGLQVVHGVAGSGKTSVAMGRLKFFANFRSGENLKDYQLSDRDIADFDSRKMIGFVLSPSLVSYLKRTADGLDISAMKIQDFEEFLNQERAHRHVFHGRPFRKVSGLIDPLEKSVKWLQALDKVASAYVADSISAIAAEDLTKPQTSEGNAVSAWRWKEIVERTWAQGPLAIRIQSLVKTLKALPEARQDAFSLREVAVEIDRRIRVSEIETRDFSPSERRVLREAVENVQLRCFRLLNPQELYLRAFSDLQYRSFLQELLNSVEHDFAPVVDRTAARLEKNEVSDEDTVTALCLNALACEGFEREIRAIPYLRSFAERIAVFVDEYQDFSELQVLLMGYKALPKYWLVTVCGDKSQQLHRDGLADVNKSFPQIPRKPEAVLLERNMRQAGPLAQLSATFRLVTEGADLTKAEPCRAPLYTFAIEASLATFAVDRILQLPDAASVAVICPDVTSVQNWFELMAPELEAGFRNPIISDRSKLTERFKTHFTTPLEAKGLEFDAVVVPDLASFDCDDPVMRNALYVAVSRPRHGLTLCAKQSENESTLLRALTEAGHLIVRI